MSGRRICDINKQLIWACRHRVRFEPQHAGRNGRINTGFPPPCGFVATAMHLAMVPATQRDSELIADLAPERPALRETQVVGIRGLTGTYETSLLGHVFDVIAVPNPARLRQRQHTFIDRLRPRTILRLL
jgi:hypothetical protein